MLRKETYFEVLSLMDKALVRGANHFSTENATALENEQARWMEMGGLIEESAIIDKFLSVISAARGELDSDVRHYTDQALELKRAWRDFGAPE